MSLKRVVGIVAVASLVASSAAASSIKISDGVNEVTIADGGVGDLNPIAGAVTFSGAVGLWIINVTTGITYPVLGSVTEPVMDFNDISVLSSGGGTLTLWFSETGFGPTSTSVETSIGGTTGGTVSYQAFSGTALFEEGALLTTFTSNTLAFNNTSSGTLASGAGPYSLTQKVQLTHSAGGVSSYNANLSVEPKPVPDGGMTLSLLGLAMVGLAALRRRL
jgi:hypothetical protein